MYIGYAAALLTTISFVPQAIKTIRSQDTEGISVLMYLSFSAGIVLWMIYGFLRDDIVIIVANIVTLFLALPILFIALRNEWRARKA